MKAWVVAQRGDPKDALLLRTDLEQPTVPAASNVIIKITYAALNPADLNFIKVIPSLPFRRQPIPGLDFSGQITAIGSQVPRNLTVGTEVCGALPIPQVIRGAGTLVEYLEVPAHAVAQKPRESSMDTSAGLGIATQTAILMLKSHPVQAGDRVIIHGASGGVGTMLVQLASAADAHVVGICSRANAEMVQRLGAKEIVDYTESGSLADLIHSKHPEPFDALYNCVGDCNLYDTSHQFLKANGAYVDIAGPGGPLVSYWRTVSTHWLPNFLVGGSGVKYKTVNLAPSGLLMKEAVGLVDKGVIHEVAIDSKFPMEQVFEAFERVASKRAKGKVLVEL